MTSISSESQLIKIKIEKDHGYLMLSLIGICAQIILLSYYVMPMRFKIFNKTFLETNFEKQHQEAFNSSVKNTAGFPDTGNGVYSQKVSYTDWYRFNKQQRFHLVYIEQITIVLILGILAGLFYPRFVTILSVLFMISKFIYFVVDKLTWSDHFIKKITSQIVSFYPLITFVLIINKVLSSGDNSGEL